MLLDASRLRLELLIPSNSFLSSHSRLREPISLSSSILPEELVCTRAAPFVTSSSTTRPTPAAMALADQTKRVVSQFEFSDADLNLHVQEFMRQMGEFSILLNIRALPLPGLSGASTNCRCRGGT